MVRLVVASEAAELATDRFWAKGATAVEEQETGIGEVALVAGFPTAAAAAEVAGSVGGQLVEVDEATWRDVWRRHAQPVRVGAIVVSPAWRTIEVASRETMVTIDPGGCFGSGTHPTTRLLLGELERRMGPEAAVFDVGTGSGILSVAAALLGASRVVAVDIDPEAVEVTRRNAQANGVAGLVQVSADDAAAVEGAFDVVVANLTAATLAGLAETLMASVGPNGVLMVSGLLPGQWHHISPGFATMSVVDVVTLDGWVGVVMGQA